MSELMQVLRETNPECQMCINAIRFRAQLVAYQEETSSSPEMLVGLYQRGLNCGGLVSLIGNSVEWQKERMLKSEADELSRARGDFKDFINNYTRRTGALGPALVEIPEPQKATSILRLREICTSINP